MTTLREDIASDLETVFEDLDDIVWSGTTIKGIFHNEFEMAEGLEIAVESRDPYIEVESADISAMVQGNTVTISSVAYKVLSIQPTGFGKSVVFLSKD